VNILTFDLEDWYQLVARRVTGELPPPRDSIVRQTELLLDLLEQHHTRATFFVLGMVAERYPELIRGIATRGHEIASHGYAHLRVSELSRTQFENDARRARDLLEDTVAKAIRGYRAPEFSIDARSLWALDILAALGFSYDSSIFPISHPRYGIRGFDAAPGRYRLPSGREITELPLATLSFAGLRAPVAGGGYFRLLPLWVWRLGARYHQFRRRPMTTYFHPYEFDSMPLDLFQAVAPNGWKRRILAWRANWRYNLGRAGMRSKLGSLLSQDRFTTCQEFLDAVPLAENQALLRPAGRRV